MFLNYTKGENLMSKIKQTIWRAIKSKRANTLLLTTAAAIATTFSVYFFVSLTTLSEEAKQRITHLYNAYTMGVAVKGAINADGIIGSMTKVEFHNKLDPSLFDGNFISLAQMIKSAFVTTGYDPTPSKITGNDTTYHGDASGVRIIYIDENGDEMTEDYTSGAPKVDNLRLLVNLAGTSDAAYADHRTFDATYPYASGDPFYYILMDLTHGFAPAAGAVTIDPAVFIIGILDQTNGGPQPDTSVILPQDYSEPL
jgi:hypothetical protein